MNRFQSALLNLTIIVTSLILASPAVHSTNIVYSPLVSTDVDTRRIPDEARGSCRLFPELKKNLIFRALVPNHTGLTVQPQPTLYWYVSKPVSAKFLLVLEQKSEPNTFDFVEPLIDTTLSLSVKAGIHALPLAKYNVRLDKNIEYNWFLSLICDPNNPSINRTAGGTIKYVAPSHELLIHLKLTRAKNLPYLYAREGFWYDALDSLSKQIKRKPSLRRIRAELLEQVGLDKVADFERK
jgi:hypothetical protein